jgi:enterochelin esterase-like enzyme
MKNIIVTLLLSLLFVACEKSGYKVTITVNTSVPLPAEQAVFVTGNTPNLAEWDPARVKLDRIDDRTWSKDLYFRPNERLEFKFSKGSWETEATTLEGFVPGNYLHTVNADTELIYSVPHWKDEKFELKGQITGEVEDLGEMTFPGLLPRKVFVWLPPSYRNNTSKKYPVLYMHDGQNIIDPHTSYTQVDWQVDEAITNLSQTRRMQEVIVVGMNNTANRRDDYSWTDFGKAYLKFIVTKVKPHIDSNYRTLDDTENTAIMGSSMGGLISFIAAWQYPDIFGSAACLSPAFLGPYQYVFDWVRIAKEKPGPRFYIDCGDVNLDKDLLPDSERMVKELQKIGYRLNHDLYWFYDKGADHNEAAWANRIEKPLLFMFGLERKKQ